MTLPEFRDWLEFHRINPIDDFHRLYRPAALISQSMAGGDMQERLDWLQPDSTTAHFSKADMNTFKALGVKPPGVK